MLGLIWAQGTDGVIGHRGGIPWHLPEDLARFRALTDGSTVIMGRVTWQSIPDRFRPLPRRSNIVVSRDAAFSAPGASVVSSWRAALTAVQDADSQVWVIGGAQLYDSALPHADVLEVTVVEGDWVGDRYAPQIGPEWRADATGGWQVSATGIRYRYDTYRRR